MEQFNDKYELENARFQTTAGEIAPYKNITTKSTFHFNPHLTGKLNHKAVEINLIGHPQKTFPTKHQYKPTDRRVDIALYDLRNQYGLNAQNVLGNHLIQELDRKRIDNIVLKHGPKDLPLMEGPHGIMTDERLQRMQFTLERQVMSEGDRIKTAQALRDSPAIKERNKRQEEALFAFRKHGPAQFGLGRIGELAVPQNVIEVPNENRGRTKDVDLSLFHEEFTGNVPEYAEPEQKRRGKQKENFSKLVRTDEPDDKPLLYTYEFIVKRGKHKKSQRNVELNKTADEFLRQYISDYDFLINEYEKEKTRYLGRKQRDIFEEDQQIDLPYLELQTLEREDATRLLKMKDVISEYQNEDVPVVILDVETSNGPVPMKLFATKGKEFLNIIQDSDLNFENEIDVVRIPIKTLPKIIKEKVKKQKDKEVKLNFDDWNELLNISFNGRFEHERVKKEDVMLKLKDSEIVRKLETNFDSPVPILTDSRAIQNSEMKKKSKNKLELRKDFEQELSENEKRISLENFEDVSKVSRETKHSGRPRTVSYWKHSF